MHSVNSALKKPKEGHFMNERDGSTYDNGSGYDSKNENKDDIPFEEMINFHKQFHSRRSSYDIIQRLSPVECPISWNEPGMEGLYPIGDPFGHLGLAESPIIAYSKPLINKHQLNFTIEGLSKNTRFDSQDIQEWMPQNLSIGLDEKMICDKYPSQINSRKFIDRYTQTERGTYTNRSRLKKMSTKNLLKNHLIVIFPSYSRQTNQNYTAATLFCQKFRSKARA